MKTIRYSTKAKKDLKKYRNDILLMKALYDVLEKLANGDILPKEYKAHALIGNYKDCMECHIKNDFLLIWIDTEHDVIEVIRMEVIPNYSKHDIYSISPSIHISILDFLLLILHL